MSARAFGRLAVYCSTDDARHGINGLIRGAKAQVEGTVSTGSQRKRGSNDGL